MKGRSFTGTLDVKETELTYGWLASIQKSMWKQGINLYTESRDITFELGWTTISLESVQLCVWKVRIFECVCICVSVCVCCDWAPGCWVVTGNFVSETGWLTAVWQTALRSGGCWGQRGWRIHYSLFFFSLLWHTDKLWGVWAAMRGFLTVPVIVVLMVAVIVQVELGSAGEEETETEEVVSKAFVKTTRCTFASAITYLT